MQMRLPQPGACRNHCRTCRGVFRSFLQHGHFVGFQDLNRERDGFEIVQQPHVRYLKVIANVARHDIPPNVGQFRAVVDDRARDAERCPANRRVGFHVAHELIKEVDE